MATNAKVLLRLGYVGSLGMIMIVAQIPEVDYLVIQNYDGNFSSDQLAKGWAKWKWTSGGVRTFVEECSNDIKGDRKTEQRIESVLRR